MGAPLSVSGVFEKYSSDSGVGWTSLHFDDGELG